MKNRHIPGLWRFDVIAALGFALFVAGVMLWQWHAAITAMAFRDGDDALRLVQVRDLLAGQSWFDVSQYRIDPPTGGLMHWSRLIDAQIAGLILLLTPLLGRAAAEQWAVALYPPLLLMPLFVLIAVLLRRLADDRLVVAVGLAITATGVTFLHYFVPLRIDHHNWQLILSIALLVIALGPADRRHGWLAALTMALHFAISLEALPYLAIIGGIFALGWLRAPRNSPRFPAFVAGVALLAPLILLATRGTSGLAGTWCDAWSRPYLLGCSAAAALIVGGARLTLVERSLAARILLLGGAAGVGVLVFLWQGRACLAGPFGSLEPLVRDYWYANVLEGQPLFRQRPAHVVVLLFPVLIALAATVRLWRRETDVARRARWGVMLLALAGSAALSLFVARTSAVTQAFALPALAVTVVEIWRRGQARTRVLPRVLVSLAAVLMVPVVAAQIALILGARWLPADKVDARAQRACPDDVSLGLLARQPRGLVMAGIDIAPLVLAKTPHAVVASGHHRNHAAMNIVLSALAARPVQARAIVAHSGADWLFLCLDKPETTNIADAFPAGLAAKLHAGRVPEWLAPVPGTGSAGLYHVVDAQAGRKVSASPFMQ